MIDLSELGKSQDSEKRLLICVILLTVFLVLGTAFQPWIDPRWLYMDTQTVGELSGDCCHVYDGAMSSLGIMIWAGTSALSILAFLVYLRRSDPRAAWFAAHAALVAALLALDDAYLLHEVVLPQLGIPQTLVIGIHGGIILSYLWLQRAFMGAPYRWLLGLALFAFAVSVGVDQLFHSTSQIWIVVEDGPKFIGIVCWFLLHLMIHADRLARTPGP